MEETDYSLHNTYYYYNFLEGPKDEFIAEMLESIKKLITILEESDVVFYKKELIRIWKNYRVLQ